MIRAVSRYLNARIVFCRAYDPVAYEDFRQGSLKGAAAALAACGALAMLAKLLRRHPHCLTPHLLDILSCLPETTPPATYRHLLQQACPPPPPPPLPPPTAVPSLLMCKLACN